MKKRGPVSQKLESRFADGRKWVCATDHPTAADFTVSPLSAAPAPCALAQFCTGRVRRGKAKGHGMRELTRPCPPASQLYGVLQHLVSLSGDANLPPTMPTLWKDAETPYLAEWFQGVEQAFPIRFHARRVPRAERVRLERTW